MLSERALLVYLSISQWTGRKLDKKATGTVECSHATQKRVGNYTKKLLPGARELEAISALAGSIRSFYYDNTLPWMTDGARILSSKNYLDFVREFGSKRSDFDQAVKAFLQEYPALRAAARDKLGDLFNEFEYPSTGTLSTCFNCDIAFFPLPSVGDFRTELLDEQKETFVKQMRDVELKATRECWTRMHEVVSKAAQKLAQPDAIFRDSLIQNISDMCALMPKLNVNEDAALEQARLDLEATVAKMSPDLLRVNATERQDAASKLNELTSRMGSFMGGANIQPVAVPVQDTATVDADAAEIARVVAARLHGMKHENAQGANLRDGIIITKGGV